MQNALRKAILYGLSGSCVAALLVANAPAGHAFDVIQITNHAVHDTVPAISGSKLVWQGWDGHDYEIYMATITGPLSVPTLPIAGLVATTGLLALAGWRRLRGRRPQRTS